MTRSALQDSNKPLKLPVYGEDSIGIDRNFQALLVKSNNDDDFETGEVQAKRATDFCLKEVHEGIDDREDELEDSHSNNDKDLSRGSSHFDKTKRFFESTPLHPYSQGQSLQIEEDEDSLNSRRSSCDF